jgi:hypothetical protein
MILYKTKYYGLLGDRVRQAIAESGRKSSEERKFIRDIWNKQHGVTPTSQRTLDIFKRDIEKRSGRGINSLNITKKSIDTELDKLERDFESGKIPYEKYNERLQSLYEDLANQENSVFNRINKPTTSNKDLERLEKYKREAKRTEEQNQFLIPPKYNNKYPTEKEIKEAEEQFKRENLEELNKNFKEKNKKIWEKFHKLGNNLRTNPNDAELVNDIKNDFYKNGGKNFKVREKGYKDSYYDGETGTVETAPNPGIASHENNHLKNELSERGGIDLTEEINDVNLFESPDFVHDIAEYVNVEEGRANKGGFRDIFLSRKSKGRNWRNTHRVNRNSNGTYQSTLGIDIDKSGMQDLDYGMSPEALKKMRENAKKLGIDLNKSSKVKFKKATAKERKAIENYVKNSENYY